MVIYRVLDEVFRSWSNVAVLRALLDTASGHSGNEIARISGMHPRSALKALTSLEELGIVRRQRGGRDHLFTLNRQHVLIRDAILPLYSVERRFPGAMLTALSTLLKKSVISAIVFGSVARKEETPKSDIDICCIVKSEKEKDTVRRILDSRSHSIYEKFGVKISPIFFTLEEFQKKSKNSLVKEMLKEGILIVGKNPRILLNV